LLSFLNNFRQRIFAKILVFICASVFTILFLSFYVFERSEYEDKKTSLQERQQRITQSQAIIIPQYLKDKNEEAITLTLSGVLSNPIIIGVAICDPDENPLYRFGSFESPNHQVFESRHEITYFDGTEVRKLGTLVTASTDRRIVEALEQRRRFYAGVFAVLFIVIVIAVYASIYAIVLTPLNMLVAAIKGSKDGTPISVHWSSDNEIGLVIKEFENLQQRQFAAQSQLQEELQHREEMVEDLRHMKDAAEQASRAKSEFLATMSHELRTPLNAIIGFSEIIRDQAFGPVGSTKYSDYANDINDSGQHLLGLINDILDLAKIESGADELYEEQIDIEEFVHSVMTLVGRRAEEGEIRLTWDLPEHPPALRADNRKLKQILVNLLSNAIKFTPAGGRVTLKATVNKDGSYEFRVSDTGIGISADDIPKALSKFGQVDGALNRQYEGTGLGLPLTKALVEIHGGNLDLESEVGVGTSATACFPAERVVAPADGSHARML
jgi:signal transduction histidine kinase